MTGPATIFVILLPYVMGIAALLHVLGVRGW